MPPILGRSLALLLTLMVFLATSGRGRAEESEAIEADVLLKGGILVDGSDQASYPEKIGDVAVKMLGV